MEQQADRRSRLVRPAVLAVHVVRQVSVLTLSDSKCGPGSRPGCRSGTRPSADLVAVDAAEPHRVRAARSTKPRGPARVDVGRRLQEVRLQVARPASSIRLCTRRNVCASRAREPPDLIRSGAGRSSRDHHAVAVQERDLQARLARHHAQPVVAQPEVADDLGAKHARDVGRRRRAAAGGDLLGDAATADDSRRSSTRVEDRPGPGVRGRSIRCGRRRRRWRRTGVPLALGRVPPALTFGQKQT